MSKKKYIILSIILALLIVILMPGHKLFSAKLKLGTMDTRGSDWTCICGGELKDCGCILPI